MVWDLGGTLIDTYPDVDRALALAAFGDASPGRLAEVAALTRVSSDHAITQLSARTGVGAEELRRAYDGVKERWEHTPAPVMPGAREVMAAVSARGGLNLVATHRDRASAELLVARTGLAVDDMVCAPDGHARKPSPEMIEVLMGRHRLDPGDVLAVGDRPVDVEAGEAAGATGVLLVTPGIPLDAGDARRVGHLGELLPLVADDA
ncbi:HAD-IA family hydrolase [Actinotalea caeni]|uniref:HAD-IA family hydrolase n=1 Tax=Actinotalea caeni TaxID=1348467 RepID=UPI0023D98A62|nr:HAD-IA family hydrolase [Actinotalea caeni]